MIWVLICLLDGVYLATDAFEIQWLLLWTTTFLAVIGFCY